MKKLSLLIPVLFLITAISAIAGDAERFKGWFPILNERSTSRKQEYFLLDVDSLENIFTKYGDGKVPPDLEQYRKESAVLTAFTNRDFLILTLEKLVRVAGNLIHIEGNDDLLLEMLKRSDGNADMATREKGVVKRYLIAPSAENP